MSSTWRLVTPPPGVLIVIMVGQARGPATFLARSPILTSLFLATHPSARSRRAEQDLPGRSPSLARQ